MEKYPHPKPLEDVELREEAGSCLSLTSKDKNNKQKGSKGAPP